MNNNHQNNYNNNLLQNQNFQVGLTYGNSYSNKHSYKNVLINRNVLPLNRPKYYQLPQNKYSLYNTSIQQPAFTNNEQKIYSNNRNNLWQSKPYFFHERWTTRKMKEH